MGKAAKAGTAVTFRTTLGYFSNKNSSYSTQTDSNGIAYATLFAGDTTGIAEITCTAGGVSSVTYVEITVNTKPTPGEVSNIALSASPLSINADGISSSTITAILTDSNGTAVAMGTSVTFTTNLGSFSNAAKTFSTTTAGTDGKATATLFAGTTPGTAKISASSGSVSSMIYIEFKSF
jgi:adhesin/invasin